ncbi:hypothetical protein Pelo_1637 [Pelomyxa schiedti]|nr:hypothetical protein Pelo_1637 [Pelomyxa schiedti]
MSSAGDAAAGDPNTKKKVDSGDNESIPYSDRFDKMMSAYSTSGLLSALNAGFALGILPTVISFEPQDTFHKLLLSISRLLILIVVLFNSMGVLVQSMVVFYFNQLYQKTDERTVEDLREMTKTIRERSHRVCLYSTPLFALSLGLYLTSTGSHLLGAIVIGSSYYLLTILNEIRWAFKKILADYRKKHTAAAKKD